VNYFIDMYPTSYTNNNDGDYCDAAEYDDGGKIDE
jgi:hypothetical protein